MTFLLTVSLISLAISVRLLYRSVKNGREIRKIKDHLYGQQEEKKEG